ncbi:hypothetical protein PIB30_094311 [Stylosanthes scabra]|uniref:Disease resistance protein Roq1-like winged-helix domain-containing protein n=1 Tax=Stylosanthes scabra TaxID=79078 RepID=A0ABU6UW62_9FABA|nr:hypothetical protein [Stylosanthes scabra]
MVSLLDSRDASELFFRKVFRSDRPSSSTCMELTPNILEYAQGLPLAIKVVGSFLYNRDASQWRDSLGRLKKYPDKKEVTGVLQISFEPLRKEEREIFLHIACFFRGQREEYVKQILDVCGLHPQIGIPVLKERSLIAIENQEIHMHDMLQELVPPTKSRPPRLLPCAKGMTGILLQRRATFVIGPFFLSQFIKCMKPMQRH